jgi:hypothetical protein
MKIQDFLAHFGIQHNPFGQEDAQSDPVFKQHCLDGTHHPAWDKVYGNPAEPSTAVVFGEKGSGKTALRLQIVEHVRQFNRMNPEQRVFIIEYDDFNPFLDTFRERLSARQRKPERVLKNWRLWDHMDAILTLGVTQLNDLLLEEGPRAEDEAFAIRPEQTDRLTQLQRRDLLLLTAFYDHSNSQTLKQRWNRLRKKLRFPTWRAELDRAAGIAVTLLLLISWGLYRFDSWNDRFQVLGRWWFWLILFVGWLPWLWRQTRLFWSSWLVSRQVRVIDHQPNMLRQVLARSQRSELVGQPIPSRDRSDDRYELLNKLRGVLQMLGFDGILVLVDRVDEPHLINGSSEQMRDLLWPMFDNKFLKHPGIGFKLLLPREVSQFLNRESKEFYERSRLDKQNLIPSLEWTGESLYDVANARIQACAAENDGKPTLQAFFDESITHGELISQLSRLRVPRHLFKFLYRLLVNHCNKYTDENPRWKVDRENLHATMALYQRDLEALDRGLGTV